MENQKNNKKVKTEQTSKYEKQRKRSVWQEKKIKSSRRGGTPAAAASPVTHCAARQPCRLFLHFTFSRFSAEKYFLTQCFIFFLVLKLKLGQKLRPYISISLVEAYYRLCLLEWLFWFLASLCYIFFVRQLCVFPYTVWLHQAPALLPHDISIKHNPGKASGKQVFCG